MKLNQKEKQTMAESKKKGGMAGKHHPKDDNEQTALGWAHAMRKKNQPPDGCQIRVKFPDGPNGTWSRTKGLFRAIAKSGKPVGTFPSWKTALGALSTGKAKKKKGQRKNLTRANGVPDADLVERLAGPEGKAIMVAVADEMENRAGELTARASALRVAADSL